MSLSIALLASSPSLLWPESAHFAVDTRKHLRIALDRVEGRIDGGEELFAKALGLSLVVPEPASEIPSNLRTVNDRQSH